MKLFSLPGLFCLARFSWPVNHVGENAVLSLSGTGDRLDIRLKKVYLRGHFCPKEGNLRFLPENTGWCKGPVRKKIFLQNKVSIFSE
jgi:hypothetical protein